VARTAACSRADAANRLKQAESFLYVAALVLGEEVGNRDEGGLVLSGVSAALAVLAGIAASDAACCS
jgi:hypothetical protein